LDPGQHLEEAGSFGMRLPVPGLFDPARWRDTGVNLAGIGMILDLLDRFRALERKNQWLRARQ
jgi:hypothetical protein